MARTIKTIYDSLITEKETKATLSTLLPVGTDYEDLLDELSSGSKVAIWRLQMYIFAFGTWLLEVIFDQFKTDVNDIKNRSIFGTELWWIDRINEFQYGYNVEVLESDSQYSIGYPIIDEAAQIVEAAALFTDANGSSTIKVAKDSGGDLVKFSTLEVTAINAYRDKIQPAGATITVVSLNADDSELVAEIYYNPLFDLSVVQTNVEAAINLYFKNLDFGGVVEVNTLRENLRALEEIEDIYINTFKAASTGQPLISIVRQYETSAGYIKINGGLTLADSLTYIPKS
jgi:hypothetical protein